MAPQADINSLLRFLAQDAKLALPSAIAVAKPLQSKGLTSIAAIAASDLATLTPLFNSQDDAKRVLAAAKRASKRPASDPKASPRKKRRLSQDGPTEPEPHELESSLALPEPVTEESFLAEITLITNRAPLLLVFALTLLSYTMPRQPLSSRLSLAQAQVSQGAKERARDLGLEKGTTAQEEGWGTGQPVVKVMSKDVRVVRRVGYPLAIPNSLNKADVDTKAEEADQTAAVKEEVTSNELQEQEETALWALDLEALKKSNTDAILTTRVRTGSGLPIYSPHSARAYIIKAFSLGKTHDQDSVKSENADEGDKKPKKSKSEAKQKEENLGLLLGALKLLFDSWSSVLDNNELSRRAWSWYVTVRPDVEHGPAGWGNKGEVKLKRILDLRR